MGMLRSALEWLSARVGSDGGESDDDEDDRFVPSVLDASVRYAHGGSSTGIEREIADVKQQAQQLEDYRDE